MRIQYLGRVTVMHKPFPHKPLKLLTTIFPGEPGLAGFIGAKDDDNWW